MKKPGKCRSCRWYAYEGITDRMICSCAKSSCTWVPTGPGWTCDAWEAKQTPDKQDEPKETAPKPKTDKKRKPKPDPRSRIPRLRCRCRAAPQAGASCEEAPLRAMPLSYLDRRRPLVLPRTILHFRPAHPHRVCGRRYAGTMTSTQLSIDDLLQDRLHCRYCEHYVPFTPNDSNRPNGWYHAGRCRLRLREDPLGYSDGNDTCPDCVPDPVSIGISHSDQRWLDNLTIDDIDDPMVQRELDRIATGGSRL